MAKLEGDKYKADGNKRNDGTDGNEGGIFGESFGFKFISGAGVGGDFAAAIGFGVASVAVWASGKGGVDVGGFDAIPCLFIYDFAGGTGFIFLVIVGGTWRGVKSLEPFFGTVGIETNLGEGSRFFLAVEISKCINDRAVNVEQFDEILGVGIFGEGKIVGRIINEISLGRYGTGKRIGFIFIA